MIVNIVFPLEKVKSFFIFRYFKTKCRNIQYVFYGLMQPGTCVYLSN